MKRSPAKSVALLAGNCYKVNTQVRPQFAEFVSTTQEFARKGKIWQDASIALPFPVCYPPVGLAKRQKGDSVSKALKVGQLVSAGRYEFSMHAERERRADKITVAELETALRACDIVEEYPDDPRGASFLILGFSGRRPIHAVCAIRQDPEELFLITVYDPSVHPQKWEDDYRRRRR